MCLKQFWCRSMVVTSNGDRRHGQGWGVAAVYHRCSHRHRLQAGAQLHEVVQVIMLQVIGPRRLLYRRRRAVHAADKINCEALDFSPNLYGSAGLLRPNFDLHDIYAPCSLSTLSPTKIMRDHAGITNNRHR